MSIGIKDLSIPFKYPAISEADIELDMIITIMDFEVEEDGTVWVNDYEISLDYEIAEDYPHPLDSFIHLFNSMLNDGRHLQERIFDRIFVEDMDRIENKCRKAWAEYFNDLYINSLTDYHNLI